MGQRWDMRETGFVPAGPAHLRLLLEQAQDVFRVGIGDRQGLDAELLLRPEAP